MTPINSYRLDIQILRGISIILVFLFHLNLKAFPSGTLGVDVFFVLSGYLMAHLYPALPKAKLKKFFIKRAKRILPAYFIVLIGVLLFAFLKVLPYELKQISDYSIYSSFLVPNIGFWNDNSYFDKDGFKPILHFWSLGVELQFYLLFPVLLWIYRKSKLYFGLFALGSLIACLYMTSISPKTSFFLTPFRIWEFMLGFYAAKIEVSLHQKAVEVKSYRWTSIVSLGILISLSMITIHENNHPKYHAILLCLATIHIIIFGLPDRFIHSFLYRQIFIASGEIFLFHLFSTFPFNYFLLL